MQETRDKGVVVDRDAERLDEGLGVGCGGETGEVRGMGEAFVGVDYMRHAFCRLGRSDGKPRSRVAKNRLKTQ